MTFPVMLGPDGGGLHPHLVFETAAYFIAFRVYLAGRRRAGDVVPDATRWSLITAAAIGAVLGSRILFWLEDPRLTLAHLLDPNPAFLIGGKTIVGGLLGGWLAVELTKRFLGVRTATGDLLAVPLAVGIAVGRIGCFLTGLDDHTYGVASSLPWAVDLGDGVRRHPTALYESLAMLPLAIVLRRAQLARGGDRFKLFMVSYLTFRLLVDALKPGIAFAGLTSIQWACAAALGYYAHWWMRSRSGVPPPVTDPRALNHNVA